MGATTTTVVVTVLGCGVVALLAVLLLVRSRAAAERARRERLERELVQARTDVATLGRRLDDLGGEVVEARRTAEQAAARSAQLAGRTEREFVITSLGDPGPELPRERASSRTAASLLEETLVRAASRRGGSSSGAAAAGLVVKAAALSHGMRRALSPDVLDRAAAEATVARRRSRRERKRELREARRVVRSVQEQPSGKHVA